MKFENNNKEVVKKLARRSLKKNKVRNIFVIIAIALTTFMIGAIFSIGIGLGESRSKLIDKTLKTKATMLLNNPSKEQIEKLKKYDFFSTIGYELQVGNVVSKQEEKSDATITLLYKDKNDWEYHNLPCFLEYSGTYPSKENEITVSKQALVILGLEDKKTGDLVEISYNIGEKEYIGTFILSGVFSRNIMGDNTGEIMVSKTFAEKNNITMENNGVLYMSVKDLEKYSVPEVLKNEIELNKNQEFRYFYDISKDLKSTMFNIALICILLSLFIVFTGYLLIYNIMYIAVSKDINFYGLLKTIGTSPNQIRKIVKEQALYLSFIGIGIGLFLSFGMSSYILPKIMSGVNQSYKDGIEFNVLIYVGAIVFSLLTVFLGCRKPAKVASNVSPIEAVNYVTKSKIKIRKTTNSGKLYKMAWYNVFFDKKRTIVVLVSLFMGIATFLSVNTFLSSLNVENYIKGYLTYDFEIENTTFEREGFNDTLLNKIINIKGIKNTNLYKMSDMKFNKEDNLVKVFVNNCSEDEDIIDNMFQNVEDEDLYFGTKVIGIEDSVVEKFISETDNKIDIEKFKNGDLVIGSAYNFLMMNGEDKKKIIEPLNGEKINLINKNTGKSSKYEITLVDSAETLPWGSGNCGELPILYMSMSELDKIETKAINYYMNIDVDKKYEKEIKNELKGIAEATGLRILVKSDQIENIKQSVITEKVFGQSISIILLLIGILNFINIIVTSINSRLKEFAVIESIGMTKKQIKNMISLEGMYYALFTMGFTLTIGRWIVNLIWKIIDKEIDWAVFKFPMIPVLILMIIIFIICLVTPRIVFKISSKKSVTERLRM